MELDTTTWKPFAVGQIVDMIYKGRSYSSSELTPSDEIDTINYITRTEKNNGIRMQVLKEDFDGMEKGNAVTIGDTTATIFYQAKDFIVGEHMIILRAAWFTEATANFLVMQLRKEKFRYPAHARAFLMDLIAKTIVYWPVDKNGNPDYAYIENYINSFQINKENVTKAIPDYFLDEGYEKACWYLDNINQSDFEIRYAGKAADCKIKLSDRDWKPFHLYDLFIIDSGNKFDKSKMTFAAPAVSFVGRARTNNGVTACVDEVAWVKPYKKGWLTVALGGSYLGSCFVQEAPFYTSQNVAVLIPLVRMSRETKLFIAHLIRYESANTYIAFARELNAHIRKDFTIKLPVTKDGQPDYCFMEKYIKSLSFSCNI